jgi:hypothetical protein
MGGWEVMNCEEYASRLLGSMTPYSAASRPARPSATYSYCQAVSAQQLSLNPNRFFHVDPCRSSQWTKV